jgi:hypothetical protein
MIYRDLATHRTSTTYDLYRARSKGRGITFPWRHIGRTPFGSTHVSEPHTGLQKGIHLAFRINALTSFFGGPGPVHMAGAVMYQQLNQQAAAMAY